MRVARGWQTPPAPLNMLGGQLQHLLASVERLVQLPLHLLLHTILPKNINSQRDIAGVSADGGCVQKGLFRLGEIPLRSPYNSQKQGRPATRYRIIFWQARQRLAGILNGLGEFSPESSHVTAYGSNVACHMVIPARKLSIVPAGSSAQSFLSVMQVLLDIVQMTGEDQHPGTRNVEPGLIPPGVSG